MGTLRKYFSDRWAELKESVLSIIAFFASAYFILDIMGLTEKMSGLKNSIRNIFLIVLIGLIVMTLTLTLIDVGKYLIGQIGESWGNLKKIKLLEIEIYKLKKDIEILKELKK